MLLIHSKYINISFITINNCIRKTATFHWALILCLVKHHITHLPCVTDSLTSEFSNYRNVIIHLIGFDFFCFSYSRCFSCATSLDGKVPFHYSDYNFCSMNCLKTHKQQQQLWQVSDPVEEEWMISLTAL